MIIRHFNFQPDALNQAWFRDLRLAPQENKYLSVDGEGKKKEKCSHYINTLFISG